jgi:1-acyl-sn-glycerol-3-phosphate acyltransferase
MKIRPVPLRAYRTLAHFVSWIVFVVVGLTLNVLCMPLLLVRNRGRLGPAVRAAIRRLFVAWCAWLHLTGLIKVRFAGFSPEALQGAAVYVANHPGLLDAPFILSRLPDAICIFKPALIRNPAIGPAALMAGYASGDTGVDLIRDVAQRVARGRSLLIFPEGTRTAAGVTLNPFRPGFALIAARARVPVRLIAIRAPRDLLPKGWPWWRKPHYPVTVDVTLLGELVVGPDESAAELTARASRQISAALAAS